MTIGCKVWGAAFLVALAFIAVRLSEGSNVGNDDTDQMEVVGSVTAPRSTAVGSASIPWARLLFSKSLPEVASTDQQVAAAKAEVEGAPRLAGIILVSGRRTALIDVAGKTHRLETGGTLGKWRIARIDVRSVSLESENVQQTLALDPRK